LLMQHFLKDLTIILSGMAFHAADTHRATSEGAARKGRLKERCGLEPRTNFFFRLRNRQKLVRISFENIRHLCFCLSYWSDRQTFCGLIQVYVISALIFNGWKRISADCCLWRWQWVTWVIRTNTMHFSFLIYFNNLFCICLEYSNYSSSGGSYCMCSVWYLTCICVY
jgi:hypothetical protein